MKKEISNTSSEKNNLHPRNPHRFSYDFKQLINSCKELASYVYVNEHGIRSIDFSDPGAVKVLNTALLKHFYDVSGWDIPEGYLCPAVPGRADYIHNIADLLGSCNDGVIPKGKNILMLDIGTGASCIYPLIGNKEYGWSFIGSDIDPLAIKSAEKIIASNPHLTNSIDCRLQKNPEAMFRGILKDEEKIDISICNPPFHPSAEAALAATQRKVHNLGDRSQEKPVLNFGGRNNELWYKGGEASFIYAMIVESAQIQDSCFWFTSLVSKKDTLPGLYKTLEKFGAKEVRTINVSQGQKRSRIIAWTFLDKARQAEWKTKRWK